MDPVLITIYSTGNTRKFTHVQASSYESLTSVVVTRGG